MRSTAEHSVGVSRLACLLGRLSGLPARDCELLEIAGLLHDVGKLRVPDGVLDKPGPLNEAELALIKRHTFETWQILRRVRAFDQIADGLPFIMSRLPAMAIPLSDGGEIPVQARIVAVADVFRQWPKIVPIARPPDRKVTVQYSRKWLLPGTLTPRSSPAWRRTSQPAGKPPLARRAPVITLAAVKTCISYRQKPGTFHLHAKNNLPFLFRINHLKE